MSGNYRDREIFTLKIIRMNNFRVVKFSWFRSIHWSSPRDFIFRMFNFRGWSWSRNYFNSEIFPIYGISDDNS